MPDGETAFNAASSEVTEPFYASQSAHRRQLNSPEIESLPTIRWAAFVLAAVLGLPGLATDAAAPVFDPGRGAYSLDVWHGAHGLPQSKVRAVAQTRDGYIWLGQSWLVQRG